MHKFSWSVLLVTVSASPLLASVDQGLLSLVPAETKVIIGLDAVRTKGSSFGQAFFRERGGANDGLEEFVRDTGFDPRRDLDYVLVVSDGTGADSAYLAFARGVFDVDRIRTAVRAKGGRSESVFGIDMLSVKDGKDVNAIAFPATGIAVVGSLPLVRQVISGRAMPTTLDPQLSALIASVSGNNDVWFVSTVPGFLPNPSPASAEHSGPMNHSQIFQSVREASGGVRLGSTVQLTLDANTRSPEDANALADVVRFAANMIETKSQNDPNAAALAPSLEQMQLQNNGSSVHIALAVPEKTFEQMRSMHGMSLDIGR